jgi:ribosomal protein S18 acetylase RimI-like enzyme
MRGFLLFCLVLAGAEFVWRLWILHVSGSLLWPLMSVLTGLLAIVVIGYACFCRFRRIRYHGFRAPEDRQWSEQVNVHPTRTALGDVGIRQESSEFRLEAGANELLLAIAGVLLLDPMVSTDVMGFLLLVPWMRRKVAAFCYGPLRAIGVYLQTSIPEIQRRGMFEVCRGEEIAQLSCPPGLQIEPVTAENVARVAEFAGPETAKVFRQYLAEGTIGVYASYGDSIVGYGWAAVAQQGQRWFSTYMLVTPEIACIYHCFVHPDFRGRKIYPNMLVALLHRLLDMPQVQRVTIYTDVDNARSIAGIERVGFRRRWVWLLLRWRKNRYRLFRIHRCPPLPSPRAAQP